ncbi:bacillaene synthase trans-acting acyltransferase/trans-AT polyketide synthase, acyltransferase and oxidoreductase domain-containing protein [Paenibacillus sp. CF095]|uniref:acyltransferase domain-containing protein n=1 Tax=Paenibacillus sp. CF095 TaxID=1881033 RepID=UPI00087FB517|nr:acyltransferase domain-containing protein [Paenibacillus sp. CF095]SDD51841.1 bacillaene synthase trans-acting acyltransferase/trans-AT polyketide synthase, acyltransferase and oxidoreductase domain-containing protein [Paenibacillus sp. CF095]
MNKRRVVFMFGGQGTQYYQMGLELYKTHPVFGYWMNRLDSLISNITGFSVLAHLYDDRKSLATDFDNLTYTHPAIFMVQYSLARTLIEEGVVPDLLLGMSLGEYVSAAVADAVEVEAVLENILFQSKLIKTSCEKGGMITVLSNSDLYDRSPQLYMDSSLVAINYDGHFVIAGRETNLSNVESWLKSNRIIHQRLPVSYAFHTTQVEPIKSAYMCQLQNMKYKAPAVPWLSSAAGGVIEAVDAYLMWQAIREPMRLSEAVEKINQEKEYIYLDLSPSGTLAAIVSKLQGQRSNFHVYPIITKFNQDALNLRRAVNGCLNGVLR